MTDQEPILYTRLGGYDAISAVVDEFADRIHHDERIIQFFLGMGDDTRAAFKQKNKNLVCWATGGPCKEIARSAAEAHNGLGITEGDFKVVVDHLTDVLNEFKVPEKEQGELMDIIATLHDDIVDRPDENGLSRDFPFKR